MTEDRVGVFVITLFFSPVLLFLCITHHDIPFNHSLCSHSTYKFYVRERIARP